MQDEHHDLVHDFPEYRDRIHALKTADHHFRRPAPNPRKAAEEILASLV